MEDVVVWIEMRAEDDKAIEVVGFQQVSPFGEFIFKERFAEMRGVMEFDGMEMWQDVGYDFLRRRRRVVKIAVKQLHLVASVQQRPANRQQAERRQMLARHAGADGRVRDVDEGDFHGCDDRRSRVFPHLL